MLVAGGGPVGLAAAIELGRRGLECVVVEPRTAVSPTRPRCKTINVRTCEHLRRWGVPAVQYWTVNPSAPALMGPIDRDGTWWIIAFGVEAERGRREAEQIIEAAVGAPVDAEVLSHDPWTARMQLVDRARVGRVFVAGDAAHLNPPFGGHGLNTGIGDAVDLGWKLAAVLNGWGGPALLDSYESERRPVQQRVIEAAVANMRVLASDLVSADLDLDGPAGERARRRAHAQIQATKHAEFHALDLVLDLAYESPVIASGGARLRHAWLAPGHSVYDELGEGFSLLVTDAGRMAPRGRRAVAPCAPAPRGPQPLRPARALRRPARARAS